MFEVVYLKNISATLLTIVFLLFVFKKSGSRKHRLFPVVNILAILYNSVDLIFEYRQISVNDSFLSYLEKLFLVFILFLLFLYLLDFLKVRLAYYLGIISFAAAVAAAIILHDFNLKDKSLSGPFHAYVTFMLLLFLGVGTYCFVKYSMSKQELLNGILLYSLFTIPLVAIVIGKFGLVKSDIILPVAASISALIALYLIFSDNMMDSIDMLRENSYRGSGAAILLFDRDYFFLEANDKAKRLFPDIIEKLENRKMSARQFMMLKNMLDGDFEREFEHGGQYYYVHIEKTEARNGIKGYVVILTNVTIQREDARLMESLKNLSEENAAKRNQLMANLSHDLKSPLNSIIGISDILMEKYSTLKEDKYLLANIKQAGNALVVLVNDLLNFSKIDANRLQLENKEYNFPNLVRDVACINIFNLREKPVSFRVNFNSDCPVNVVGDELRVREIIQNLLSNAVKFTEQGSIVCEINCRVENEDALFDVRVKDTGCGMTESQLNSIFSTYVSFAGDYNQEGSGLGLVMVKHLSELMGGKVFAESDGESGSTVGASFHQRIVGDEINKPIVLDSKDLFYGAHNQKDELPSYTYPSANVLLVDDLLINQEIFRAVTASWQFNVDHAENGMAAINLAKKNSYDMIVMDLLMPGMDGIETFKKIREFSDVPVVLMSANISPNKDEEYKAIGFDYTLSKPFEIQDVKKVIEAVLPEEKREVYVNEKNPNTGYNDDGPSAKALLMFSKELKEIMSELRNAYESDLDLFRIKVHGVKGASRQFGYIELSERSEVMEMAAKVENKKFIDRHLPDYIHLGKELSREIERAAIEKQQAESEAVKENEEFTIHTEDLKSNWEALKKGFEDYDADLIEENLQILEKASKAGVLSDKEVELLMLVYDDYSKLDYEAGLIKVQEQWP